MPLDEFWNDDPKLLWVYRSCFMEREKRNVEYQQQMIDYQSWLTGYYVQYAISACLNKNTKYPSQPIGYNTGTNVSNTESQNKSQNEILAERIKNNLKKGKILLDKKRGGN